MRAVHRHEKHIEKHTYRMAFSTELPLSRAADNLACHAFWAETRPVLDTSTLPQSRARTT